MLNLPEANDQRPSLEELGPEYDQWLDDLDSDEFDSDSFNYAPGGYHYIPKRPFPIPAPRDDDWLFFIR
mgnify:CR=1 FL=1